ncbi:MAG: PHP domain-containing protein, partial [Desulfobacteraceae bacterium]|nr:PHP domain-containing protein [Desulfobacteraceae bacterium]
MIPLTVRSNYSLMWGTSSIDKLCRKARRLGYKRLALTDSDNLCGLIAFMAACKKEGLIPIVGAEITDRVKNERAVCLVKDKQGYSNLCRLITKRHRDKGFDLKKSLPEYSEGLVVLTNNYDHLKDWHKKGLDVAAALHRNPLPLTHKLCKTAKSLNVPLVATPGSFFRNPEDAKIHKMLRAIEKNTSLSRLTTKDIAPDNAFLASASEYQKRFEICPQAIENTYIIKEKLKFRGPDFGIVMPPFEDNKENTKELLSSKVYKGAVWRYGNDLPENIVARIEYELKIINQMNFSSYFLVVHDIIKTSPRICGRGSGAASIIAYCLGITNVCPVKFNLYFERFLNPGRDDPPDIDIDFAWDERDDVLNSVFNKFKERAAMVSSHVLFQPRMAVREVAKVFGLPDAEIGQISKRLPWFWKADQMEPDLIERIKQKPEFKFIDFPHPWPEIMKYAEKLTGNPRYLSVHPGGIVITPDPIDTYVPIETAPKGVPIMQ